MFQVFNVSLQKGFHITFENGWTVSVQWGIGNYSSDAGKIKAADAEIAAWDKNGIWYKFSEDNHTVKGWVKPDEVADFIAKVKAFA